MKILQAINYLRRTLMRALTRNIGRTYFEQNNLLHHTKIERILICRPNDRLGNLLLITPLIQEITSTFPGCKIDLFVKGNLAPILFKNFNSVENFIQLPRKPFKELSKYIEAWKSIRNQHYDIVVNVYKNSSSGRLSTKFAKAQYKFFGENNKGIASQNKDYRHMSKYPVYIFRAYLTKLGLTTHIRPVTGLDLRLSPSEIAHGKELLNTLINSDKKTICLFT